MNIVVSIIVNSNNQDEYLEKTLVSILEQSFDEWECLIINNGFSEKAQENALSWCKRDSRFKYLEKEENTLGKMRNVAIANTQGEYLLFINSGDSLFDKIVLSNVFSTINPIYELIYGNINIISTGKKHLWEMPFQLSIPYLLSNKIFPECVFIKRSLYEKHFKYNENLKYAADWAFIFQLISFRRIKQLYITMIICNIYSPNNIFLNPDIYNKERKNILTESFSLELFEICSSYNKYKSFYYKKPIKILRKFTYLIKGIFTKLFWKDIIYRKRINPVIRLINKRIRQQRKDPFSIPVIIISYNRVRDLKRLVSFLLERGHKNIIIVDNHSSYTPLLNYYDEIKDKVTIKMMDKNYGHLVFWHNKNLYNEYCSGYHIITDSDIIPNEKLPTNYIRDLMTVLDHHKNITKVGFALKIDDIPEFFNQKQSVINWEKQFWKKPIGKDLYSADLDTTFAIYPPNYNYYYPNFYNAIRIAGNFTARHGGWYINNNELSEEDKFYFKNSNTSNSWKIDENGNFRGEKTLYNI